MKYGETFDDLMCKIKNNLYSNDASGNTTNIYPEWWDKLITLYNKYTDVTGEITWYKSTLSGCYWKTGRSKTYVNNEIYETEDILCRIPKNVSYLPCNVWRELENKTGKITISLGDIIVLGEVQDEINEYITGSRSNNIIEKYKGSGILTVESFSDNTGGGKSNEHYLIRGV